MSESYRPGDAPHLPRGRRVTLRWLQLQVEGAFGPLKSMEPIECDVHNRSC